MRIGMRYARPRQEARSLRDAAAKVLGNEAIEEVDLGDRPFTKIELGSSYRSRRTPSRSSSWTTRRSSS
jgi:hypothetical protein